MKLTIAAYRGKPAYYVFERNKLLARGYYTEKSHEEIREKIKKKKNIQIQVTPQNQIEELTGIYRSAKTIGMASKGISVFEYRVWVHTAQASMTEGDLDDKMQLILNKYYINSKSGEHIQFGFGDLEGTALNREIEESDIEPTGTPFNEWRFSVKVGSMEKKGKIEGTYIMEE